MKRQKNVLLALGYYSVNLVRGIVSYSRENNWRIVFLRGRSTDDGLRQWRGEGIISNLPEDALTCRSWKHTKIVSLIHLKHRFLKLSLVRENDYEIGQIAAEFFLRCGHVNFAAYSDTERLQGFRNALGEYGFDCDDLRPGEPIWRSESRITEWLLKLPKPCAVFCENDWDGMELLTLAKWNNIEVPRDISILGIGNDLEICQASDLALSSIDSRLYEVGRKAAEELDRLMDGGEPERVLISPNSQVVERKSTDVFFSENKLLTDVVVWMKKHYHQAFTIETLAKRFAMSESAMYKMFVKNLKISPKQLLLDLRLKQACTLLEYSDLTIDIIASKCGFPTSCAMFSGFRRRFGCAPGKWRKQRLYLKDNGIINSIYETG